MAENITASGNTDFIPSIGANKVAFVKVTGTWDSASVLVQTRNGNGEWETYPTNGTQTADFSYYYQLGDEGGVRLASTVTGTTDLWAQVMEARTETSH